MGYGAPAYGPGPQGGGFVPPYAQWIKRVAAAIINGLISAIPALLINAITGTRAGQVGLGNVVSLAIGLYLAYMDGTSQSPGKKMLNIRIAREADGQLIGGGAAIGRQFLHIIDALPCYIGFLWPLWDGKKQTFADKIMHTVVVDA